MREWQSPDHALSYLARADSIPHRSAGEATLIEELPAPLGRVLDLGSGDGRLLCLVLDRRPGARFAGSDTVEIVTADLAMTLPDLGRFDAIVSSFAIHHLEDPRKRALYAEVWAALEPGGVFCNLEHVSSASSRAHARFLEAMGTRPEDEDPSNRLLDVHTQLAWLRAIGFADVDCYWKWRELALLVGRKPR
jgi:tRNA (cmo5U34)-methyltransferase